VTHSARFEYGRWTAVAMLGLWLAFPASASSPVAPQTAAVPAAVVYTPASVSVEVRKGFEKQGFKLDPASGNYLSAKVYSKTLHEPLVPVLIDGRYATDLQRKPIFLRKTVRDKLLEADAEMFKKNQHSTKQAERHIILNYGFRSNALQQELFVKLKGHGKVAPPGASFHETGMALDVSNTKEAHKYLIHAGFVGGCDGIEEDQVHYSVGEISKASDFKTFRRCTIPGLFDHLPFVKKKK
jgi:hypothetical protein